MKTIQNLKNVALASLVILLLSLTVSCKKDVEANEPEWLFVQNAQSVTLNDGVLTLTGINPTTVCFTDRPERMAALSGTDEFVEFWNQGAGKDSFIKDPPNATLSIVTQNGAEDVVLTLMNPILKNDMLKYDVEIIEGNEQLEGGAASLFIDVIGRPLTPVSVAGVARRTRRRTVARMAY